MLQAFYHFFPRKRSHLSSSYSSWLDLAVGAPDSANFALNFHSQSVRGILQFFPDREYESSQSDRVETLDKSVQSPT